VLAIGIVVDDAIIIVENASHHIDQGMRPREATIKAMDEVTGPVLAFTVVQLAVFIPTVFLGGITGQLYQQFALTISATALISAVNALSLKPVQAAAYLRPGQGSRSLRTRVVTLAVSGLLAAALILAGYVFTTRPAPRHLGELGTTLATVFEQHGGQFALTFAA